MGGRISVESVVRCSWNGWPDDRGIRSPYGGIDNIAHCGGGDSKDAKPCPDVLYDSERLDAVDDLEHILKERLATAQDGSPLMESLVAQQRSLKSFRRVIGSANGR